MPVVRAQEWRTGSICRTLSYNKMKTTHNDGRNVKKNTLDGARGNVRHFWESEGKEHSNIKRKREVNQLKSKGNIQGTHSRR